MTYWEIFCVGYYHRKDKSNACEMIAMQISMMELWIYKLYYEWNTYSKEGNCTYLQWIHN